MEIIDKFISFVFYFIPFAILYLGTVDLEMAKLVCNIGMLIIAGLALGRWKKELQTKKKIDVLEKILQEIAEFFRIYGYFDSWKQIYDIRLKIKSQMPYIKKTDKDQLYEKLEDINKQIMELCDLMSIDDINNRNKGKYGERLKDDNTGGRRVELNENIRKQMEIAEKIIEEKLTKTYQIS